MSRLSYSKALNQGISEEMRRDGSVFFVGLDIGAYGGAFGVSKGMIDEFGAERIIDMPISEAGYTGLAVGAAATGLRPIVELQFGDWVTIASDQLVNQAANMRYMSGGTLRIPMVMRLPCGGFGSAAAQHSHMFESWFAFVPGLKVVSPSTPADAKGLIKSAIRDNNPVLVFEHRQCYALKDEVPDCEDFMVPIGKADIKREGRDLSLITHSYMVHMALKAAEVLEKEGIDIEVVDLRTIRPLDTQTILDSVRKTQRAVCLQETWLAYGVAAEVAAVIAENHEGHLKSPLKRIGSLDCPVPFSPKLERHVLPSVERIVETILGMF
jgi:pyruvate/2-oxoglutarate/acetoin dehydrogenase E1 component